MQFHQSPRADQDLAGLTMGELFQIVHQTLECASIAMDNGNSFDPEAKTQSVCAEVERRLGVFPNATTTVEPIVNLNWNMKGSEARTPEGWYRIVRSAVPDLVRYNLFFEDRMIDQTKTRHAARRSAEQHHRQMLLTSSTSAAGTGASDEQNETSHSVGRTE